MPPPVLIQVNLGREAQKGGVVPEDAAALVSDATGLGLEVRGLMAIPPRPGDPEDSRSWFRDLAALRTRLSADHPGLVELSMGMTDDLEVAVDEGATLLRVGRAIFGPFEENHRG